MQQKNSQQLVFKKLLDKNTFKTPLDITNNIKPLLTHETVVMLTSHEYLEVGAWGIFLIKKYI